MALRDTFLNMLGVSAPEVPKTDNSVFKSARDFLRYGNREKLYPDWSDVKMPDSDMYRGYSYAVIQKRSNKVATLAKNNLSTWAKPEVVDAFQDKDEPVLHPYLKLIEDSTEFSEKQFWKNISIYLDLAGRYYLGVIRNQIVPSNPNLPVITTDATRFVLLNPYEIRRVIDKDKNVAGYIERKKDGRYREWPKHQIIEMRELNPFDPENSQWAMTDAAKEAVYTINQSSDYTRQSLHGNIEAPGIITTDVLLSDQDFANFRARVTQHQKGEPLFGNGTGAIKWDAMQIDLDKAALMDINEINRTTLFAVSGTSKTSLGIEQSGTTRETARVQSEQFIADTAQPRLEDIVDFLNLDYKKNYFNEYKKTGYYIEVKSAVGRDYDTEQKATALKQSQFQLAMQLMQAGYTEQSAYQFAEGEIDFGDLELEKGLDKPQNPENPSEGEGSNENSPNSPKNGPQSGSGAGDDNNTTSEQNSLETAENDAQDKDVLTTDLNELEPHSDLVENKTSEDENSLPLTSNGGKGSGNFGHSGRPGEVGGSGKGVGGIETLEKNGVKIWNAEKEFFAEHPEEIETISKVVDEYRKMGLKMEFKLTANRGMVADNLDDLISTAYVGRTVTNDEYDSTVFISRDLFEKGGEGKAYKYKEGEKQPVCTDDTLTGVMRHELGHLFVTQLWLRESGHKGEIHGNDEYNRFNDKLFKQSGATKPYDLMSGKRGKWSRYAEVSDTEAIAEAFSNPNFSSDTKKVYDYVRKYKPEKTKNEVEKRSGVLIACIGYPEDAEFVEEAKKYLQKNGCTCEHDHKVEHFINEVQPEEGKEVKEAYDEFLTEIRALEKETINAVARKLTTNAFDESDIIGKRKKATITDKIKNAIRKYWWLLLPLFANNGMSKRNKEFGENIIFTFDNALQNKVINNADRVAKGHMDTILNDILEASNKVYTDILEGAAADLVVTAYRDNPEKFSAYFDHEPTRADALASIRKTDLLEQNRRIYDRANKMAFEGYERGKIVKAVRAEYKDISENRATLIARNETARAFGKSQFEADRQFLNAVGKLGQAYKIWYSRRPAGEQDKICPFCRELIEQSNINPVPFDKPFVEYGNSLEVVEDGKVKIFTADYEDIEGGTLHPNCSCGYKLVFKNAQGEFVKTLNGGSGSGNFGHSGRPGLVGGSGNGSGLARLTTSEWSEKMNRGELRESVSLLDETNFDYVIVPRLERMDIINEGEGISEENTKKNLDRMTSEEREALVNYTSEYNAGNSSEVNHYLRTGEGNESTKKAAELVSSALDKCSLGEDTVCFRGVEPKVLGPEAEKLGKQIRSAVKNGSSKQFKSMEQRLASLKGMEIQDKGCLSTSKFYDSKYSNLGMTMVIRAKKNDKACDIHSLSRYGQNRDQYSTMFGYSSSTMETEVLFAPNTKLKVKDAKLTDKGILVECETISDKTKNSLSGVELNGGKGSGNFGHQGRPGVVGGSGDGGQSTLSTQYPEAVNSAKRLVAERPDEMDDEYLKKVEAERERLFNLYGEDKQKADAEIRKWNDGEYMWDWKNQDKSIFSDIDVALSKAIAKESNDNSDVYRIQIDSEHNSEMTPTKFASWTTDMVEAYRFGQFMGGRNSSFDLFKTKVSPDNVVIVPDVMYAKSGLFPVKQYEYVLANDKPLKAFRAGMTWQDVADQYEELRNSVGEIKSINGGKGSGNFGHAGRPGEVGGSGKGTNAREQFNKLKEITNWTDAELHSVTPYFGSFENTAKVQEYLRGGDDSALTPYVITSDCVRTMKRKMEQTTFPEDTTLYRGMMIRNDRMERVEKNGFSYPGFQSTTLVGNDASRIIQEYRDSGNYDKQFYTPVLLKINAKKGGHFASSYTNGEHEIVLPDNVEFKVKNKKPTSWGAVIYEVDYE